MNDRVELFFGVLLLREAEVRVRFGLEGEHLRGRLGHVAVLVLLLLQLLQGLVAGSHIGVILREVRVVLDHVLVVLLLLGGILTQLLLGVLCGRVQVLDLLIVVCLDLVSLGIQLCL